MQLRHGLLVLISLLLFSCSKQDTATPIEPIAPITDSFTFSKIKVNEASAGFSYYGINTSPVFKISFSAVIDKSSAAKAVVIKDKNGVPVKLELSYEDQDKTLVIKPAVPLQAITKYFLDVQTNLTSDKGKNLNIPITVNLITAVDEADKFPVIAEDALLDLVQKQTFKYFWDFAHPESGLARERNTSADIVTSGGSGFGMMALVTGIHRNFISRDQGLERMQKIVAFLKNKAQRFHGAYPHWMNGNTGAVVPFSPKDNGADLVETSLLMQGMLTARQFFDAANPAETALRTDITRIYMEVEWDWFVKDNSLYWHWSPTVGWEMNLPIKGWNEALITYVLAASSESHPIQKTVYDTGWASNGAMKNSRNGPLFFSHYSFLGINPNGLSDVYGNYENQTKTHAQNHYNYAKANLKGFYGYGENCWGLSASDDINGYLAHEPANDNGVISPTAALGSFPYTPKESMQALKYYYYKLGDKIWGEYGFTDAFSLHDAWFANSTLAIDQGPILIMIENHRSQLLWKLFMSSPEVKTGMKKLGFTSPNL
ncbi:glucoamylase family protein [Pedobacter polysacchareus]|uniref:glucoamylase family protein n=1 Tax=Pedobacter polysacchareus TaxID=2861973 RepID=UPI001C998A1E|nr:glucoamylase family protein [Pedobacter polysacchareus]